MEAIVEGPLVSKLLNWQMNGPILAGIEGQNSKWSQWKPWDLHSFEESNLSTFKSGSPKVEVPKSSEHYWEYLEYTYLTDTKGLGTVMDSPPEK